MNIFFWRKNKIIDNYSIGLADEFFSSLPPQQLASYFIETATEKNQKKLEKKVTKKINVVIEPAVNQIKEFVNEHSLGVYGKARLHLKFINRLEELGYDEEIAKALNESIMLRIPDN